jgi:hypothetical protein
MHENLPEAIGIEYGLTLREKHYRLTFPQHL